MNLFTNNPDFYPTPKEVIEQMMMGEDVAGKIILEPSAGSGNIVGWLQEQGAREVIACENDPHCRKLLADKCRLVADDFLTVTSEQVSHVDMIVMNPPFSKGVQHIQHAFDIAPAGCTVVALCNADNLKGYNSLLSANKVLCENIELYGYIEDLGEVFKDAERKTGVRVALVKLFKEGEGDGEFADYMFDQTDTDTLNANETEGLVQYNVVRELVNRYVSAVQMFDEVMDATRRINDMAKASDDRYDTPPIEFRAVQTRDDHAVTITREVYKKQLKQYYWRVIFRMLHMEKYQTQSLSNQMNRFIEKQENVPFTMGNIYKVLDMIVQTHGQRMHKALVEAFEYICEFSAENSTAGNTWKTNANYMVNRKFIVPGMCDGYDWRFSSTYGSMARERVAKPYVCTSGYGVSRMVDVTKALCYITGRDFNDIPSLPGEYDKHHIEWGEWFFWGFFRCKAFKKGTMHFEFLDEDVWYKFNAEVAKTKGWTLPKKGDGWQQSPSKLIPRIDKGDCFRCKKDVRYSDGTVEYRKDMVYRSEREHNYSYGFITNESGNANHAWPIYQDKGKGVDDWRDWFEKVA